MAQTRHSRITERFNLLFVEEVLFSRHQIVNLSIFCILVAEGIVSFGDKRLGPFRFAIDDYACVVWSRLLWKPINRAPIDPSRLRFGNARWDSVLGGLFLELGDFCGKFGCIVCLCDETILLHQHLNALLLIDHLLLIIGHFKLLTPLMHLSKFIRYGHSFTHEGHCHPCRFDGVDWLACDRV